MADSFEALAADVVNCFRCPRLVEWRERVAREKRAAFRDWDYWGRPLPGFGDPDARVVVVGLAPAAHGGNRTGRFFTGDRSGDWLFRAMHATGFANQPTSISRDDGLQLTDAYVTAVNRCPPPGNRPTPKERDNCLPYLARDLALLKNARVLVALGSYALAGLAILYDIRPKPRFAHAAEFSLPDPDGQVGHTIICTYHPSQQNTFTGRLTEEMLEAVFRRARERARDPGGDA